MRTTPLWMTAMLLLGACAAARAGSAVVNAATVSGPAGSTRMVGFSVDAGSVQLGGLQIDVIVPAALTVNPGAATGPGGGTSVVCSNPQPDLLICIAFNNSGAPILSQFTLNVPFTARTSAALGNVPINFSAVDVVTQGGVSLDPVSIQNGAFQVILAGPGVFSATPSANTVIDWGHVVHGQTVSRQVLIRNVAEPDFQSLQISNCTVAGSPAFALQAPLTFPQTVIVGGSLDVQLSLSASAALPTAVSATLACLVQTGASPVSVSWPLQGQSVPDALLLDGFE